MPTCGLQMPAALLKPSATLSSSLHTAFADVSEITTKTGNHKSYAVFVTMLLSALQQTSDSVCIDLLTYSDLEVLKAKRLRRAGQTVPVPAPGSKVNNKRYLILTYQGEFDKVHYPLPLAFEEYPDHVRLKATIVSLRGVPRQVLPVLGIHAWKNCTQ
jgi:hypothetical protein